MLQKTTAQTPLTALLPQVVLADDHVAAKIGSVEDDPIGRLLQQAVIRVNVSSIWLHEALVRAIKVHNAIPEHFVDWSNRLALFDDVTILLDGVEAWYAGDLVKTVHVLAPQVERGVRAIAGQLHKPVTKAKAHSTITDVGVSIGMGDVLYSITDALGPDLSLYFLSIYADPRGLNVRNLVAHGLIKPESISQHVADFPIHTLLVFGVWKKLAEKRR
jgi:lysyl-tRNA synthetase class 1